LVAAEDPPAASQFLDTLKRMVDAQRPAAVRHNRASTATAASALPPALLHARMVFVRRDEAKPPLTPTYAGPYEVLERSNAFFKLQIGDKVDIVATARRRPTGCSSPPWPASAVQSALCSTLSRIEPPPSPRYIRGTSCGTGAAFWPSCLPSSAAGQSQSLSYRLQDWGGRCSNDLY
jgi:hypothetical protein